MISKTFHPGLLIAWSALAVCLLSIGCLSETQTVPNAYQSITATICAASAADTVYVRNGYYNENVLIQKPIRL